MNEYQITDELLDMVLIINQWSPLDTLLSSSFSVYEQLNDSNKQGNVVQTIGVRLNQNPH